MPKRKDKVVQVLEIIVQVASVVLLVLPFFSKTGKKRR